MGMRATISRVACRAKPIGILLRCWIEARADRSTALTLRANGDTETDLGVAWVAKIGEIQRSDLKSGDICIGPHG